VNTAAAVVEALARAGIRRVFGCPGSQNMRFIEEMRASPVEFVLVTHEASAGFMADVTARLTLRPGACLSTLGPGATNMTTGVGNALLDRVPVLAFTGTMGERWRGRTVQMQIDHRRLYAPLTKWSAEIRPATAWRTMARAIAIAEAEQPGPVHLDFPEDVAEEARAFRPPRDFPPAREAVSPPDPAALARAAALLTTARRPLVAVGLTMNRAGATDALRAFVDRHRLPVVSTLMAKGHVAEEGGSVVGVLGRARRDIVSEFCREADLVLAVGYDPVEFNYEEWVAKDLPIVHVDTVAADLDGGHRLGADVVGDLGEALRQLAALPPLRHAWDLGLVAPHRRLREALTPTSSSLAPHQVLVAMRELLPDEGLLVADVGAHTHVIGQLWDPRGPGRLLVSNGWSSMGFCIPAAIAAKLARPDLPVAGCTGDGGFLMMAGEINTAVRLRLPVVFVVLRDRCLSLIRVKQDRRGFPCSGVELYGPDYRASDTLFGAPVVVAHTEDAFREAFSAALVSSGPTVIEAVVDPAEYEGMV
jgi:acetolactate synthase-1/2/3 large subunit